MHHRNRLAGMAAACRIGTRLERARIPIIASYSGRHTWPKIIEPITMWYTTVARRFMEDDDTMMMYLRILKAVHNTWQCLNNPKSGEVDLGFTLKEWLSFERALFRKIDQHLCLYRRIYGQDIRVRKTYLDLNHCFFGITTHCQSAMRDWKYEAKRVAKHNYRTTHSHNYERKAPYLYYGNYR